MKKVLNIVLGDNTPLPCPDIINTYDTVNIKGDLRISETFNFDGNLIVDGNLTFDIKEDYTLNLKSIHATKTIKISGTNETSSCLNVESIKSDEVILFSNFKELKLNCSEIESDKRIIFEDIKHLTRCMKSDFSSFAVVYYNVEHMPKTVKSSK